MKLRSGNRQMLAGVFALLLLLAGATTAAGQSGKGAISGRVTDSGGGILQGAKIELESKGVGAVSDGRGEFYISGLDAGSYTLAISYLGFKTLTKGVDVTAGQSASVEAKLEVEWQRLEVLVTAERASGEAEEINRQVTADNVLQVLSADVIRSLPNANLADALGRLPSVTLERDEGEGKYVQVRGTEPRLTNATIDGINIPSPENGV